MSPGGTGRCIGSDQVGVQLPVRVMRPQQVRGVDRQGGLAQPAGPDHRRHHDGPGTVRTARPGQQVTQVLQMTGPTGEVRDVRRQLGHQRQRRRGWRHQALRQPAR